MSIIERRHSTSDPDQLSTGSKTGSLRMKAFSGFLPGEALGPVMRLRLQGSELAHVAGGQRGWLAAAWCQQMSNKCAADLWFSLWSRKRGVSGCTQAYAPQHQNSSGGPKKECQESLTLMPGLWRGSSNCLFITSEHLVAVQEAVSSCL